MALELIALGTIPETMVIVIFLEEATDTVETAHSIQQSGLGFQLLAVPMNSQTSDLMSSASAFPHEPNEQRVMAIK